LLQFLVFANGTGYDLSGIAKIDSYFEAITTQNLTFYFHPCGDSTKLPNFSNDTENDCKDGYSLCMFNSTLTDEIQQKTTVLGKIYGMDFRNNRLLFPQEQSDKIASITLECASDAKDSVLYAPMKRVDPDRVVRKLMIR
jgi:hypothetical protein